MGVSWVWEALKTSWWSFRGRTFDQNLVGKCGRIRLCSLCINHFKSGKSGGVFFLPHFKLWSHRDAMCDGSPACTPLIQTLTPLPPSCSGKLTNGPKVWTIPTPYSGVETTVSVAVCVCAPVCLCVLRVETPTLSVMCVRVDLCGFII